MSEKDECKGKPEQPVKSMRVLNIRLYLDTAKNANQRISKNHCSDGHVLLSVLRKLYFLLNFQLNYLFKKYNKNNLNFQPKFYFRWQHWRACKQHKISGYYTYMLCCKCSMKLHFVLQYKV